MTANRNGWPLLAGLAMGLAPLGAFAADYISAQDAYVDTDHDRGVNYGGGGSLIAGFQQTDWLAIETGMFGAGLHAHQNGTHLLVGSEVAANAVVARYGRASLFLRTGAGLEYAKPQSAARFSLELAPGGGIDYRLYSNLSLRLEVDERFVFGSPGHGNDVANDLWIGVGLVAYLPHSRSALAMPPADLAEVVSPLGPSEARVLREIHFTFDSAELTADAKQEITESAKAILARQELVVELRGNADSIGDKFYNLRLAERRAASVQQALIAEGVAAERIAIRTDGEYFPEASNQSADGRAENRRVVIVVYPGIPAQK